MSLNLFTYVSNNPLRYTDPSGHKQCEGASRCDADVLTQYGSNYIHQFLIIDEYGEWNGIYYLYSDGTIIREFTAPTEYVNRNGIRLK